MNPTIPHDEHEELEIERARARVVAAQEEAAFVRGDVPDELVEARIQRMSRRSFLWGALAVGATVGGVRWVGAARDEGGVPWPLRHGLQTSEELWRDFSRSSRLARTYPASRARAIRTNGSHGLSEGFDPATWQMQVRGLAGAPASVALDQIKALPKIEMTTELKCIEGWATVVTWSGARLSDWVRQYADDPAQLPAYVGLSTPDGAYYVGIEREAALHPQTLLCYEMNGQALAPEHGAPLRLVTPIKYGIKSIKRIGRLEFTDQRPDDYWAQRGYDYYSGF